MDFRAQYERAVALLSSRELETALEAFRECVHLDSTSTEALYGVAHTLDLLGRRHEAARTYRKILQLAPELASAHCALGAILIELAKGEEALSHINTAISLDPSDPICQYNLGVVLHTLGRHLQAVEAYKRAIGLAPDYWEAYDNLSTCLGDLGRWSDAVRVLEDRLTSRGGVGSALAYQNLGIALRATGRYEEAEAAARRCLESDPENVDAWATVAGTLADRGRWAEAIPYAERVIRAKGDSASGSDYFNLGIALAETGRVEEADAVLRKTLELSPHDLEARLRFGAVLVDAGKPQEALEHVERVLENRPHSPEAHCVRGAALHRLGKNREAAKAFNRAERAGAGYFGRHPAMRELYEAAVKETKH